MANTRLGLFNLLAEPGVVLKNGTGGGAPALIEVVPYKMSNLLNGDRYSLWKTPLLSNASTYSVDFDLGFTASLNAMGLLGYRLATGSGPGIDMLYQTGAYTPGGAWVAFGNTVAEQRDTGEAGGTVSARSVRFTISPTDPNESFSLGAFFAGSLDDLGGIHSLGGARTPFQNRLETPFISGSVALTRLGDDGQTWTMPWHSIPDATRAKLLAAQSRPRSFVLVDADSAFSEVYLRNGAIAESRGAGPSLYDINIELVRMP